MPGLVPAKLGAEVYHNLTADARTGERDLAEVSTGQICPHFREDLRREKRTPGGDHLLTDIECKARYLLPAR